MAVIETWFAQDVNRAVKIQHLDGNLFTGNGNGNRIGVELTRNGEAFNISGTVSGVALLSNGTTVPCIGSKSGNKASILIPASAYYQGVSLISIIITDNNDTEVTTVLAVSTNTIVSRSDITIDPGSVITDWTNTINEAMQEIETAAEAVATKSVRYDTTQSLTDEQKARARTNMGAADAAVTVRYDTTQSLTTEQKAQARTNISAAEKTDVDKLETQFYNGDNILAGKEFTYPASQNIYDVLFTRMGLAYYKIYGTASNAVIMSYFNSLTSLPERIKPGNTYFIHVEGHPVRIAYSKNGTTYGTVKDYEEGDHEFTVPSDAVGMTIRLYVANGSTVDAESRVIIEDISALSSDYTITKNKNDIDRLTGLYAPYMVFGGYNFVDGEDVPHTSTYMADRRAIVPIGNPLKLDVGDKIIVDDPALYYYYATYDYEEEKWNIFDGWHQGGEVTEITIAGDYYIVIRKGQNIEVSSINELTYKFAIVKNSQPGFIYNEIEDAKKQGSVKSALDSLPAYYHEDDWIENKIADVKEASEIVNGVCFAFVTDLHFNANSKNSKFLIKAIMDNTSMNIALCGGDIVGLIGTVAQLKAQTQDIVDYANYIGKDRFFIVRGNHDFYNRTDTNDVNTTTSLSEGKAYDTLCRCGEFVETDMLPAHMCYTVVNEAQKTVYLMMNSKDGSGTVQSFVSGTQAKWISEMLLKYKNYYIVAVSHIPSDSALTGYDSAQAIIHTILAAFQAKTTINTTHDGVSIVADYSSATGVVLCNLNGHSHSDQYHFADNLLSIVTTCDAYYHDDGYNATAGTITEQAIDVFCIDYDNHIITAVRVGRGNNRSWNYQTGQIVT